MLELERLDTFYGRAQILFGLTLSVQRGEVVVLMGRNGAGKSTTLKSIMGLVRPATGRVQFLEQAIHTLPSYRIAQLGLGYVPEERRVFPELTILENLEVGRQTSRRGTPSWTPAKLFELFPNLAELQRRPAGQTSGGEQQMLSIARTLMGNPKLLLLDEPSEGLAPVIVEQMAKAIQTLKRQGLGILLSEQNLNFARQVGDRAYVLEQGHLRWQGGMADLHHNKQMQADYLSV